MTTTNITPPTVGRKLWYYPSLVDITGPQAFNTNGGEPLDATVLAVWGDHTVNALVWDIVGNHRVIQNCLLVQSGEPAPGERGHLEWMPYQVQQAAKHAVVLDPTIARGMPEPDALPIEPEPSGVAAAFDADDAAALKVDAENAETPASADQPTEDA